MSESAPSQVPHRILHLEDSLADHELIVALLRREWPDIQVQQTCTSSDFSARLKGGGYDLILSDFTIPGFDGLSGLKMARQLSPDTPYIFLSGTIGEENAVETLKQGATDYVQKDRMRRLVPVIRRALAEADARRSKVLVESRLREQGELLDKANDAICVATPQGRVTYWNEGASRLLGVPRAKAIGSHIGEHLFQGDGELCLRALEAVNVHGTWTGEIRPRLADDRELILDSRWTAVRNPDGGLQSILIINADHTEQKNLEERFLRAQRLDSIGMLAGGIAHDLNNMLAPILMSVGLLKHRHSVTEEDNHLFSVLEQSTAHASGLVRQVLTFARGAPGERNEIQPKHVLVDVAGLLRDTLPRNITVTTDLAPGLSAVRSSITQLTQVLMNLGVNARDAMPGGGVLTLSAANVTIGEDYAATNPGSKPGPFVRLSVADTGTGIPREILDRIFDPFFTTKELGKGTGLGLSTVLGIVRDHGGFVTVDTQPGKGSRFHVHLPAVDSPAVAGHRPKEGGIHRKGHGTVLVIDDETAIRVIFRSVLETAGYSVLTAADGAAGLEVFRSAAPGTIRVVLVDMMMPGMSGAETIEALLKIRPDLPLIAMSGLLSEIPRVEGNSGKTAFLQKPMSHADLLGMLDQVLANPNLL